MSIFKTKLVVLVLVFSAIGCGGGGGGGLDGVRSHNANAFNGYWRSTTQVTHDNCNVAGNFSSFLPNVQYTFSGDDFDVDVREANGMYYLGEMLTATQLGGIGDIGIRCPGGSTHTFSQRIDLQLVEENRAQIDVFLTFTCPNRPTCNISSSGVLDFQSEL